MHAYTGWVYETLRHKVIDIIDIHGKTKTKKKIYI